MASASSHRRPSARCRSTILVALVGTIAWSAVAALGGALSEQLFVTAQRSALPLQAIGAPRSTTATAVRAQKEDLPAKRVKKEWQRPFPKYIVGSGIFFTIVGLIGGGPQLAFVFGICGVGFGSLFEPFQLEDGTISGLD
mmetsp:Transcript_89873/g.209314  ORF Transcript_89873/g.209314 Transcript_89873/m.209314 type:complete len:140 (-) Transcript_89873:85-504(-)